MTIIGVWQNMDTNDHWKDYAVCFGIGFLIGLIILIKYQPA